MRKHDNAHPNHQQQTEFSNVDQQITTSSSPRIVLPAEEIADSSENGVGLIVGNSHHQSSKIFTKVVKLEQLVKQIHQNKYYIKRIKYVKDQCEEIIITDVDYDSEKKQFTDLLNKLRRLIVSTPDRESLEENETTLGCIKDSLRQHIWPLLLHDPDHLCKDRQTVFHLIKKLDKTHEQYEQVEKDVERSLFKFLAPFYGRFNKSIVYVNTSNACSTSNLSGGVSKNVGSKTMNLELNYKRKNLSLVVNSILQTEKRFRQSEEAGDKLAEKIGQLYYFQGFHEICSVLLLTFQDSLETTYRCSYRLAMNHFHDAMHSLHLDNIMKKCRMVIKILEKDGHEDICQVLRNSDMDQGHYALSWILTWFAHVIDQDCHDKEDETEALSSSSKILNENSIVPTLFIVQTLFDVFLSVGNPMFVVYLAASVVIERKQELLILRDGGSVGSVREKLSAASGGRTEVDFPFSADEDEENLNYVEFTVVFGLLNRFPKNVTLRWIERIIGRALSMWKEHDYRSLFSADIPNDTFPFQYMKECENIPENSPPDYWRDEEEERLKLEAKKRTSLRKSQVVPTLIVGGIALAIAVYISAQTWFFQSIPYK